MTAYDAHELALVFPPMSEPEFAAFKEDIREQGQQESIVLYEGKILDGLHRYRACRELGREPHVVRFEGNPRAAAQLVLGRNFHRRHPHSGASSRPRCASYARGEIRGLLPI